MSIEDLRSRRRMVIPFGEAPDGLPWRLLVDRGQSAADLLFDIAVRLGYHAAEQYRDTPFDRVVRQLNDLFDQRDVRAIDGVDCYISGRSILSITGPSLLAMLFSSRTRTVAPGAIEDTRVRAGAPPPPVGAATQPAFPPPVRADIGTSHLALPLNGGRALAVKATAKGGGPATYHVARPYEPESLAALKSARFEIRIPQTGEYFEGAMSDASAYRDARLQAVRTGPFCQANCRVDRAEIVSLAIGLAARLRSLHDAGHVHGDVKPANTLVTTEGVRFIDSLDLAPGSISPAMTPGWAAPEQIVGAPVQSATDQYPLGLLLCGLLGGVLYGEEVTFVVPVGGAAVERFRLMRNPGVYLPAEDVPVDAEGVRPWQQFLDRCLRFRPEERFPSMADLGATLAELNGKHPVGGQLTMTPWFGSLEEKDRQLSWSLADLRD